MHIVELAGGTLRFLDHPPARAPSNGFIWIYLEREALTAALPALQQAAYDLGGSPLLDLHIKDLGNSAHPSHYDYTSVYDLVIFRRLATGAEPPADDEANGLHMSPGSLPAFGRIHTQPIGFVTFDRLLITVHAAGCVTARSFIERFVADAAHHNGSSAAARSRLPSGPADLMLRMLNVMVDSYLDLRKHLARELDHWQHLLLQPRSRGADWGALMSARQALHTLEDLCDEQHDAVQEWLDTLREQQPPGKRQAEHDSLVARARDVIEHIARVVHHVRRMEQGAETAVQIHFSALSHQTNETMRVLTALTAVFLPLNLITGFFGMNFEFLPLIHSPRAMWVMLTVMVLLAAIVVVIFWRKRYLSRPAR
jgi:Mg2+ and Co2+ transporter CorA